MKSLQTRQSIVLLDAELTFGLPKHITAATGIDAMVHAIEAYTSIIHKNPLSDALALTALRKLDRAIVTACDEPSNVHGLSNALVLTEVMKYNAPNADHWYEEIARDMDVGQTGNSLIDKMEAIKDATRVPQTLREVNISADAIPMMAEDAMTKDRLLMNNAREMTYDATVKIYGAIL